ncbi:AAA domain-containing protein [Candidatus Nitrotoga arctica]|uniref:AAA domain-containing protein n=1 Tax=Candidatus Nitrotoga arctica TaxID=453162 RepID=UPI001EFB80AF|nr:AAA domain-containing protein [Candidatus Nitrotoga arctica]
MKPLVVERDALAEKLLLVAPGWAEHIIHRVSPHHQGQVPGDFVSAWVWRQLHDTLAERDKLDAQELQREIEKIRDILRQITLRLIDAKAWGKQLERLQGNHTIRQALVGWSDTMRLLRSVRQIDRRQTLQSEARQLMKKCVDAVPVWIMPISIMAESFDPRTTRFDVVIIDEASQADLNALIPLYMGKQVIIVGDHEQVTPLGVGKGQAILNNLIKSMLKDIPLAHLFDNMSSIYDIGRQSFGEGVRLVEHFRCVPEIIAFSNKLSYDGEILPLRESNSTNIKPACVACRVDGGIREGDTNKAEAERIIATIKAMIRHPMYAGKSIGIISMLGNDQAVLIQSMLHKEVEGIEIEKRRIQAGISGEFQGDERDIIFLSMVDSSSVVGTLRTVGVGAFEQTKKRYNVAVSRAKDQLWVVHSFDPALHLNIDDLRFKLLQHVKDPLASLRAFNQEEGNTESPFEREVLKRLTDAGFKVKTQWQVGYFRIDIVVEGGGKRLAVECDGDRYHPMEQLAKDMDRQTILERLGWQFVRIRGCAFYRDKELSMRPVFTRLAELEIPPEANADEQPVSDMTLVHELDAMIKQGVNVEEVQEQEALVSDAPDLIAGSGNQSEFGGFAANPDPDDFDHGQIELLLGSLGGMAPLDDFLREFAKAKGFQRLGSNVRKGLESELERLSRTGKFTIESGVIRLI